MKIGVKSKKPLPVTMSLLVQSILYDVYRKEGLDYEGGNVRHVFYTHIKQVLMGVLGMEKTDSMTEAVSHSWTVLVNSGLITYEGINVVSEKEAYAKSIVRDSPFFNLIVIIEKKDFYKPFKWIPDLFNCIFVTAGGPSSIAVVRAFVLKLKNLGVDLNQDFHICCASDFDAAGFAIQNSFVDQLKLALEYYGGGAGKIVVHRLFVRPEQVTQDLVDAHGIIWMPKEKNAAGKKRNDTLWRDFCELTKTPERPDGGLYIKGERGMLEMDAFSTKVIERQLIRKLIDVIKECGLDTSKIMIPEVMRIFRELRDEHSGSVYDKWDTKLLKPKKDEFLQDTDDWELEIDEIQTDKEDEINGEYDKWVEEKEQEKRDKVTELFENKDALDEIIDVLNKEEAKKIQEIKDEYLDIQRTQQYNLDDIEDKIEEECKDLNDEIESLESERIDKLAANEADYEYRMERLRSFREEHSAIFNPLDEALRSDIRNALNDKVNPLFRDLERKDGVRSNLVPLINDKTYKDTTISAFDCAVPTFTDAEDYLREASEAGHTNIGQVRKSLPSKLKSALIQVIREMSSRLSFEIKKDIDLPDLRALIDKAKQELEEEIEEIQRKRDENDN